MAIDSSILASLYYAIKVTLFGAVFICRDFGGLYLCVIIRETAL